MHLSWQPGNWHDWCLHILIGEFLQLGSKENETERFAHYLEKTFKKTASLIANSCKAVCTFRLSLLIYCDIGEGELKSRLSFPPSSFSLWDKGERIVSCSWDYDLKNLKVPPICCSSQKTCNSLPLFCTSSVPVFKICSLVCSYSNGNMYLQWTF